MTTKTKHKVTPSLRAFQRHTNQPLPALALQQFFGAFVLQQLEGVEAAWFQLALAGGAAGSGVYKVVVAGAVLRDKTRFSNPCKGALLPKLQDVSKTIVQGSYSTLPFLSTFTETLWWQHLCCWTNLFMKFTVNCSVLHPGHARFSQNTSDHLILG